MDGNVETTTVRMLAGWLAIARLFGKCLSRWVGGWLVSPINYIVKVNDQQIALIGPGDIDSGCGEKI